MHPVKAVAKRDGGNRNARSGEKQDGEGAGSGEGRPNKGHRGKPGHHGKGGSGKGGSGKGKGRAAMPIAATAMTGRCARRSLWIRIRHSPHSLPCVTS